MSRGRVQLLLWIGVVVMLSYWTLWYADRSSVASNHLAAYYQFENAFPLADGWLVVCLVGGAISLRRGSPMALLWVLAGGGGGLYLFGMDGLYDLEHGIWWKSGGGVIEAVINVVTLAYSIGLLRWGWSRRTELLAGTSA